MPSASQAKAQKRDSRAKNDKRATLDMLKDNRQALTTEFTPLPD